MTIGKPFNKGTLHYMLTNVTYRGRVKFEGEIYQGEHPAIVSDEVFQRVQALLEKNRRIRKLPKTNGCHGVLEGILYCAACESRMIHTYTSKETRRYRYYLCSSAQKRGWESCPSKSIPALEIEQFVMNEVHGKLQTASSSQLPRESCSMAEQAEALAQVVDRVDYDGRNGDLHIRLTRHNRKDSNGPEHNHSSPNSLSCKGPSQGSSSRTPREPGRPPQ